MASDCPTIFGLADRFGTCRQLERAASKHQHTAQIYQKILHNPRLRDTSAACPRAAAKRHAAEREPLYRQEISIDEKIVVQNVKCEILAAIELPIFEAGSE
ncbi:hypothetical protein [Sinorhizobium saheli]|uniref:hypothetical protein n=1 Tax=Sinorhizobium saheli TaxID=36856 RepID=UPI001295B333|nr:hypothetical protein [Sinorhizobium saheli]MQW86298.1 hypothetical protein [Sinorhizobium saheli]